MQVYFTTVIPPRKVPLFTRTFSLTEVGDETRTTYSCADVHASQLSSLEPYPAALQMVFDTFCVLTRPDRNGSRRGRDVLSSHTEHVQYTDAGFFLFVCFCFVVVVVFLASYPVFFNVHEKNWGDVLDVVCDDGY